MRNSEGSHHECFIIIKNKSEGKERQEILQRTVARPGGAKEHRRNDVVFAPGKGPKK